MRPSRAALATAAVAGITIVGVLADRTRRERLRRSARVGTLTGRRALDWARTRARAIRADEARRQQLLDDLLVRSAEDIARELGQMKGVVMKAGQMLSFILDGLPEPARNALATLQGDVPPLPPGVAEAVVERELGARPTDLFAEWSATPFAAASIGQVHRARLHDGREVAVKVQYPGIDRALTHDLSNAELLYNMFSAVALKSLDVRGLVDELRRRMADELNYVLEAELQMDFCRRYDGHPFVRIPRVIEDRSSRRVLTTELDHGLRWAEFLSVADVGQRQHSAEAIFRFVQGAIYRAGVFNGDPHPGNYLFHLDGRVTFLDFGLVKRWEPGELESLLPMIDPLLERDVETLVEHMEVTGFLVPDHGLEPEQIWNYVIKPYRAYMTETFEFEPDYASKALSELLEIGGPYEDVMNKLSMPASFVLLDRVIWGMSAILGQLGARNRWKDILAEYRFDAPPTTPLGEAEAAWAAARR